MYRSAGIANEIQASIDYLTPLHDAVACPVPICRVRIKEDVKRPPCGDPFRSYTVASTVLSGSSSSKGGECFAPDAFRTWIVGAESHTLHNRLVRGPHACLTI